MAFSYWPVSFTGGGPFSFLTIYALGFPQIAGRDARRGRTLPYVSTVLVLLSETVGGLSEWLERRPKPLNFGGGFVADAMVIGIIPLT